MHVRGLRVKSDIIGSMTILELGLVYIYTK
jgi:hypothetical protein